MADHPSITCPVCGMTSYHPKDVEHAYCGNCHEYTGNPDGCIRAYLRKRGEVPTIDRVARLVIAWFEQREAGSRIIDWLPEHHAG
jgi:hypothetical protein